MIIYLYGPDSYRRQEKLKWYAEKFKEKHSALTVEYFNLEIPEHLPRLKDFAAAQSLFNDFKFGVLEGVAETEPKELDRIFRLANDAKSLTLVISTVKELPKDFKVLKGKEIIKHEFEHLSPAGFTKFVEEEAAGRKLKLSPASISALSKNHRENAWGLITELDKLVLGGAPEQALAEYNFFALITKLQKGPVGQKIATLERLLSNEEPAMIFNMLAAYSRAQEDKTKMADYDVAIKSGKLDYEEALLDAILV